jgi:hypothetical protein
MSIKELPEVRRKYQNQRYAERKEEKLNAIVEMYLMFRDYKFISEVLAA